MTRQEVLTGLRIEQEGMIMTLYEFPNPNNGDRYDLSQEELNALLYKAYMNGYQWGREISNPGVITTASSIENKDDNTR